MPHGTDVGGFCFGRARVRAALRARFGAPASEVCTAVHSRADVLDTRLLISASEDGTDRICSLVSGDVGHVPALERSGEGTRGVRVLVPRASSFSDFNAGCGLVERGGQKDEGGIGHGEGDGKETDGRARVVGQGFAGGGGGGDGVDRTCSRVQGVQVQPHRMCSLTI
jgi:hypothetical protein